MSKKRNKKNTGKMKIYSKNEMINYVKNEIEECIEYYPVPNIFLGLNVEESLTEQKKYLDSLNKKIEEIESGKYDREYQIKVFEESQIL